MRPRPVDFCFRNILKKKWEIVCPSCNSPEVISKGRKYAVYPAGCFVLIGLPYAILHRASTPMLYACGKCRHEFGKRTTLAKIAFGVLIAICLSVLAFLVIVIVRL